jgi:hypothetical protein
MAFSLEDKMAFLHNYTCLAGKWLGFLKDSVNWFRSDKENAIK